MSDLLVLGGASLWQSDAVEDVASSAETSVRLKIETKPYALLDEFGELLLRRIRLIGSARSPVVFTVTPIVDGRRIEEAAEVVTVAANATGSFRRFEAFVFPFITDPVHGFSAAPRGTELALEIATSNPGHEFHLDAAAIAFRPLGTRRRDGA